MMKSAIVTGIAGLAAMASTAGEAQSANLFNQTITGTRLELSAQGDSHIVPDIAVISAGVVTQSYDAGTAVAENATKMKQAVAALKSAGVADKDIRSESISLSPQYRYDANKPPVITGYQASNQITIRFRDIAKSGTILDALVRQGINQINGPSFVVDKPEAALDLARAEAIKKVRAKADLYARSLGMTVKRVVVISESSGGFMPMPQPVMMRANMATAEAAATQVAPGEQTISVSVNAVFELQ